MAEKIIEVSDSLWLVYTVGPEDDGLILIRDRHAGEGEGVLIDKDEIPALKAALAQIDYETGKARMKESKPDGNA